MLLSLGEITRVPVDATEETVLADGESGYRKRLMAASLVAGAAGATFTIKQRTSDESVSDESVSDESSSSESGVDPDTLVGTIQLTANGHWLLPASGIGYCESAVGLPLVLLVTAGSVGGVVSVQTIR